MNSFPKITSDAFRDFGQDVSPLHDHSCTSLKRNLTTFGIFRNTED